MSVIGFVWALGFLYSWRRFAGQMAWGFPYSGGVPDKEALIFGAVFGCFAALIWPLSLLISFFAEASPNGRLIYTPPRYRDQLRARELGERERRIAALERELDLSNVTRLESRR